MNIPLNSALLLVDIQNDFLPGGALPVTDGDEVIFVANLWQEKFDHVIATLDWHPANHASFARTHGKQVGEVIDLGGIEQILWPVHCVAGTPGADLPTELHHEQIEYYCKAGEDPNVDSYSGFFDNKHLRSTGLADYLKQRGITRLYVLGLATDYCVKYTVLDACQLGFEVAVIRDGCRAINLHRGDEEKAYTEMAAAGAAIIT